MNSEGFFESKFLVKEFLTILNPKATAFTKYNRFKFMYVFVKAVSSGLMIFLSKTNFRFCNELWNFSRKIADFSKFR
jgi:hypothetical protein